jgi:hypothetical protein
MEEKRLKLEEASDGLREVLKGRGRATGVGPNGTAYHAWVGPDGLIFVEQIPYGRFSIAIPEPEGVVWKSDPAGPQSVRLEEVSGGLRRALEEARWPDGRRIADGMGADGKEYYAGLNDDRVVIYEIVYGVRFPIPIAEPEGVVWKPTLTEREWVKIGQVSEGLRKALEKGQWPDGRRLATGEAPDGTRYNAAVVRNDLIEIGLADIEVKDFMRFPVPLPEPEGVNWEPLLPSPSLSSRRRAWWQFWK